jgi:hypothetical protein
MTPSRWAWLALALGIFFRVGEYMAFRPLYLDEVALGASFVRQPIFRFNVPLLNKQSSPPGFVVLERVAGRLFGGPAPIVGPEPVVTKGLDFIDKVTLDSLKQAATALRFLPLVAGIAALFLIRDVARRWLDPWAEPVAVILLALADEVLYYCSEIKQYSTDLALALACLAVAARLGIGEPSERGAISPRRIAPAVVVGVIATWVSIVSVFTLAGIGAVLILGSLLERNWRRFLTCVGIGLAWAVSFAGSFTISTITLDKDPFIWIWWDFAFLPIPPRSLHDAEQVFWHFVNIFVDPGNIWTPLGPLGSAILGLILFGLGAWGLGRKRPDALIVLVSPILLTLAASGLRKYPFHGRTILFLVPSILLLVAEGVALVRRRVGLVAAVLLLAFLLCRPLLDAWDHLYQLRARGFDTHGDLRPDLLDEFDRLEQRRLMQERLQKKRGFSTGSGAPSGPVP